MPFIALCLTLTGAGLLVLFTHQAIGQIPFLNELFPSSLTVLSRQLAGRFQAQDYRGAIDLVDRHFDANPVTGENVFLLAFKAAGQTQLNKPYGAIAPYQQGLPVIRAIQNVERRRYAPVFFSLGELYHRDHEIDKAITMILEGLRLESQNLYAQIMLGEYYLEGGQRARAVAHYEELLESPGLLEEQRVVVLMKLRRLGAGPSNSAAGPDGLERQPFYRAFSIHLLPVNGYDASIHLQDLCRLLESKFLMPCRVLDPVQLDEQAIWNDQQKQYDAKKMLSLLTRRYPDFETQRFIVMAFTGKDIYAPKTNFVFSWQDLSKGIGIVSSARFVSSVTETYEPALIPTRRMGIQSISTSASLLGFQRATKPQCPTSYPESLEEFLQKSSKLCESTVAQRDAFLQRYGGRPGRFEVQQIRDIEHLYERYYFK